MVLYPNWAIEAKIYLYIISLLYKKSIEISTEYEIIYQWQKAHLAKYKIKQLSGQDKFIAELNFVADELAKDGHKYDRPTIL